MYGTENPNARRSFVEESVVQIQSDAARGGGDYLNALAELSGCPETEFKTFARTVHKQYSELFPAPDATEFMGKIDSRVKSHAVLKRNCTGLGQGLTSKTPSSELTKNL